MEFLAPRSEESDELSWPLVQPSLGQLEPQVDVTSLLERSWPVEFQVQRLPQESWLLQPLSVHEPERQEQSERVLRVPLRSLAPRVAVWP